MLEIIHIINPLNLNFLQEYIIKLQEWNKKGQQQFNESHAPWEGISATPITHGKHSTIPQRQKNTLESMLSGY